MMMICCTHFLTLNLALTSAALDETLLSVEANTTLQSSRDTERDSVTSAFIHFDCLKSIEEENIPMETKAMFTNTVSRQDWKTN